MFRLANILLLSLLLSHSIQAADYKLDVVADRLDRPWALAFLPDGDFLVSFLHGELRRISADGELGEPIENAPASYVAGQGGFFDVVLDPNFASNQQIYLAFAHGSKKDNTTRVVSATLSNNTLLDVTPIFSVKNSKDTPVHYGGKLAFLNDGTLLLTTGDGFDYREAAQDPFSQLGKVVRMTTSGGVPADNPFADGKTADPYVFTFGHRSPQGLLYDAQSNVVYMHEHGPKGGDEINVLTAGANYGWPATSHGVNYSGAKISPFETLDGIVAPIKVWRPSIAPSGMALYTGDAFPQWQGSLFLGTLVNKDVRRITLAGGTAVDEEILFAEVGQRVREIRTGPDGLLYFLTEVPGQSPEQAKGQLIRVSPVK